MRCHPRWLGSLCVLTGLFPVSLTGLGRCHEHASSIGSSADVHHPSFPSRDDSFEIPFEKYVLDNGLEVILHRDASLPNVAVNLWYHVGATHERPGRSGFAHLFEHLMFEGSRYAGRNFDRLLESVGGTNMNGTTSWDRTNYYETVPSEHLELALWLEADRMGFLLDALGPERLEVQRGVVKNERRQSYDNTPYGPSWLRLYEELFPEGHPYRGAVIGSMADLDAAQMHDVRDFFQHYYAPGNATLCLAGHFDPSLARGWIDKYFATLPARGGRAQVPSTIPSPTPGTRAIVREPVHLPQFIWAWLAPAPYTEDETTLRVLVELLGSGKTSRLYQALILPGLANDVEVSLDSNRLASILTITVSVASQHRVEEVEAELAGALRRLTRTPPAPEEVRRAQIRLRRAQASDLQYLNADGGEEGRAGVLQRLNHYLGDPSALPRIMRSLERVRPEHFPIITKKYLSPERRTTVVTIPTKPKGPPAPKPEGTDPSTPP